MHKKIYIVFRGLNGMNPQVKGYFNFLKIFFSKIVDSKSTIHDFFFTKMILKLRSVSNLTSLKFCGCTYRIFEVVIHIFMILLWSLIIPEMTKFTLF